MRRGSWTLRLAQATPRPHWIDGPLGAVQVGHAGDGFAFDNETPRHTVWLQPYRIADQLVSCGEFADFIAGMRQLAGSVWQWTRSSYDPDPGYQPWTGSIGDYNGKFMVGQVVLRGGSVATPPGHARSTYRNFFPPAARWQFTGLRLAKDGAC